MLEMYYRIEYDYSVIPKIPLNLPINKGIANVRGRLKILLEVNRKPAAFYYLIDLQTMYLFSGFSSLLFIIQRA